MMSGGSDPERRFAILLEDERDDLKWFKPARNQFKIFYRAGDGYEQGRAGGDRVVGDQQVMVS